MKNNNNDFFDDDEVDNFNINLYNNKHEDNINDHNFIKAENENFLNYINNNDDNNSNNNNNNDSSFSIDQECEKNLENEIKNQNEQNLNLNNLNLDIDEKSDEELLKLTKEEIIQFKNFQILKLKAHISSLEKDKEDLINDYKMTTENLLERIKELEYQKTGTRPETGMITNKINRMKKYSNNNNNNQTDLNKVLNDDNDEIESKQRCPNCGKEIESIDFMAHSLQCLRKKFKCQKCDILLNAEDKEEHYKNYLSIEKINIAIKEKDIKYIKLSLEHGFNKNTNILDEKNENLLIHLLAINDLLYNFSSYLEEFDMDKLNKNKETPLILCIYNKSIKSAKELILKGANINIRDKSDMSPLMLCCKYNLIDVAVLILKHGGDVNEKNILGETPLKIAQLNNNDELAIKLIKFFKAKI